MANHHMDPDHGGVERVGVAMTTPATTAFKVAVTNTRFRIVQAFFMTDIATDVTFKDSDGTVLPGGGPYCLGANGGFVLPPAAKGWMETPTSKGLSITSSAAAKLSGSMLVQSLLMGTP